MSTGNPLDDLDTIAACNAGAEIELLNPMTRAPLGIFIKILGKDSDVCREHLRTSINENIRRAAMAKKRGKEPDLQTYEKTEERGIDLLVACTVAWRTVKKDEAGVTMSDEPVIVLKGEALTCTKANVKKLYEALPWIKDQVDEGIVDLENFMPI